MARTGVREFLGTRPRLVVCGGRLAGGGALSEEVLGLNLAELRWVAMPALLCARYEHACCTVRGALVVLGGTAPGGRGNNQRRIPTSRVEMLLEGAGAFIELPPLSCGAISGAAVVVVDEDDSVRGQVLLLGGSGHNGALMTSSVQLVDLNTGVCTPQADLLHARHNFAAARLPDGRVVCTGGRLAPTATVEMLSPPVQGATDAAWTLRELPAMSVGRCRGCVLSDGRFAVLGGMIHYMGMSSCEALSFGADERWTPLPSMHDTCAHFVCAAVAECIIVAGGWQSCSAEVYDEVLGRWLRLPCNLPHNDGHCDMGSALM